MDQAFFTSITQGTVVSAWSGSPPHGRRERITMRSPVRKYKSFWLGCLLLAMACCPALAAVSGEITQVRLEPQDKRIAITSKGKVGKHLARVIGRHNRLVMDFEDM